MADILLISTADWDHPIWTNKQHVACALAELGHRVLYVESLGLRSVRVDGSDYRRVLNRLRKGLRAPRQVTQRVWCWSPLVLPGARGPLAMRISRLMFQLGLQLATWMLGWEPAWIWTYNPKTLAYYKPSRSNLLVYHCVDDIQTQPGMNSVDITSWESQLCERSDVVFTTSPALQESRHRLNQRTFYFPNVADHVHFARALSDDLKIPEDLASIPAPRIGFIGAISQYKLDFQLLVEMVARTPHYSWVMVGPVGEGEGSTDLSMFRGLRNVHFLSTRPYQELPALLKGFDVAILPLQKNAYTHSMFPMKFFEYLGAGVPVVASDIDSLLPYAEVATLVSPQPDPFLQAINNVVLRCPDFEERQHRSSFASQFNYRSRTKAMLECIENFQSSILQQD